MMKRQRRIGANDAFLVNADVQPAQSSSPTRPGPLHLHESQPLFSGVSPIRIEEYDDGEHEHRDGGDFKSNNMVTTTTMVSKQHLVRPVAMRPQDAVQFYKESSDLELPLPVVHQAVQDSYAWHRQWTTEAGRLEAERAAQRQDQQQSETLIFESIQPMMLDRCRNPSPQDDSTTSSDDMSADEGGLSSRMGRTGRIRRYLHKRDREGMLAKNLSEAEPEPVASASALVRPQARRLAVRPGDLHPIEDEDDEHADRQQHQQAQLPRTSGGTPHRDHHAQLFPSHFAIKTGERPVSPLSLDVDLVHDDDILQTVEAPARAAPVAIVTDDEAADDEPSVLTAELVVSPSSRVAVVQAPSFAQQARERLLQDLAVTKGETSSECFQSALKILQQHQYHPQQQQTDSSNCSRAGMWLTLTKPTFFDCLGETADGDPMYTLGRMSFGLCAPTNLVCSLQGNFNSIERVVSSSSDSKQSTMPVPKSLRDEVLAGDTQGLEKYNIITAFTIEPQSPAFPGAPNRDVTRPIRGLMTTYGYIIPDPLNTTRHTVWITGGRLEPNSSPEDVAAWKNLFAAHPPQHTLTEHAKLLAVQWLMGATLPRVVDEATGAFEYTFERPLGGHGVTYMDVLYADESLRIWRGHRGTTYVFARTAH